jgi:hypothetical protein
MLKLQCRKHHYTIGINRQTKHGGSFGFQFLKAGVARFGQGGASCLARR